MGLYSQFDCSVFETLYYKYNYRGSIETIEDFISTNGYTIKLSNLLHDAVYKFVQENNLTESL